MNCFQMKNPYNKASKNESQLCPNHKGGVGQAFRWKIHHFGGEFKMGVAHHYHHKKEWEVTRNLMIAPTNMIAHFLLLMTFWMKSLAMNYIVLAMAIVVITISRSQRKIS